MEQFFLSPHKIWKVNGSPSELTLNGGVTMGFEIENRNLSGRMSLSRVYQFGLFLHFTTIVATLATYIAMKRKGML